jgi:hypothetical protein
MKMELDPEWYRWKTALTLVQAAGRGVRHEKENKQSIEGSRLPNRQSYRRT